MKRLAVFLTAALLVAFECAAQPDPSLVAKLREGGYVLYLRHTSTDFSKNDANMRSYEDCANQRPLTDKGRDEARSINAQVKRLKIPIGTVLASPYCRTMETARLAFGRAEPTQDVRGGPLREDQSRYDPLKKLLSTKAPKGENVVVASHGNPYHAVAGAPYLAEGEVAVVRPEGNAGFTEVARIRLEDWAKLGP
jgi:phosphohistidine phosphatase SixA